MINKLRKIETAKDTSLRLSENEDYRIVSEAHREGNKVKVDSSTTYQTMVGFGGAFTEAATYTLARMSEEKQNEVLENYFHPKKGLGYSIGRVHIHSCDFAMGNYTYVDENDIELKTFSIDHEKKWTIPFIKRAMDMRGDTIKLLASPWSPPAWMKDTKEMNNGGKLLPAYFEAWAKYYVKFIKEMRKEGLDIDSITIQNEPAAVQTWDSCIYTAEDERDFVKNHLGPIMHEAGLQDIKIYIWDHNRDIVFERAKTVLEDPEASKYVYGTGVHWYVSEEFENLGKVHDAFPDKHILFTEGCQEGGVHLGVWKTGERYGRNMIGDFSNWCEGYLDWNIVLDETGGPNHVNNLCDAPIIADTTTNELHYNSSYYYIGHFSKYVAPGAKRISCESSTENILAIAFKNLDKSIVTILMNETDQEIETFIEVEGRNLAIVLKAHSIVTFIME